MAEIPKVLVLIESSRGHGRALLRGIAKYIRLHQSWIVHPELFVHFYVDDSSGKYLDPGRMLQGEQVNGVITRNLKKAQGYIDKGIPVIVAIHLPKMDERLSRIVMEHEKIGEVGAEFFLEQGFKNFAFCGFKNMYWSKDRFRGFERRVNEAGYEVQLFDMTNRRSSDLKYKGERPIEKWLLSLPKPTGLMAVNDDRGQFVVSSCKRLGLCVPEEIAVVGVDNDDIVCDLCSPSLSSVDLNTSLAGYEAAALLDRLMNGEEMAGQTIKISPTRVVKRRSTDIIAVEDEDVSQAVNYIRQNIRRPIQVQDVADAIGLGRRTLERRFDLHLKCSVNKEIQRMRTDHIAALLCETNISIGQIVDEMKFSSINHIARYFKQEKGMSLVEYRQKNSILL